MRVVHSVAQAPAKKPKAPTAKEADDERVIRWIRRQQYKDYKQALIDFAPQIEEIRKKVPDFTPKPKLIDSI